MLSTKILSSFWSDAEIGELSPLQKLAVLWILTNRDTNNLGLAKVSKRQFEFDTGVSIEELETALKRLPRTFPHDSTEHGLHVLALNYIERQFGDVASVPSNHVYKHLCRVLAQSGDWVQQLLLSRYKGLARGFYLEKGEPSPSPASRAEQSGGEQRSKEQSRARGSAEGGPFATVPEDREVMAFALDWPGEPSSGAPQMPETFVHDWLSRMNSRTVGWPLDWKRALVADWRGKFRGWGKGPLKNGGASTYDLKTRLAAVDQLIEAHPANPNSTCGLGEPSTAEEQEYQKLVNERGELARQLGGLK